MWAAEMAVDVGIGVFWVLFGLVWLRWRNGKSRWHLLLPGLLGWMERLVQDMLEYGYEKGRVVYRPFRKIGAACWKLTVVPLAACWKMTVVPTAAVWIGYRVVQFFSKEWWEREDSVDFVLSVGFHLLSCLLLAIGPVGIGFALLARFVRHHNAVEICNLCGKPASDKLKHHNNGRNLCTGNRPNEEIRLGLEDQTRQEQQRDVPGEQYDLQRASKLPSG